MKVSFYGDAETLGIAEDGEGRLSLHLGHALLKACEEVNKGRVTFRTSAKILGPVWERFNTHPDRKIVEGWLKKVRPDEGEMSVFVYLCGHVLAEWDAIPRRTITEHRIFNDIEDAANNLLKLIEQTGSGYYRGGGHGLQHARVSELLLPSEQKAILDPLVDALDKNDDGDFLGGHPAHEFPTFEEIVTRVAIASKRLADAGPIHSQPNKRGAERGFFVRRLAEIIQRRYGEVSAEVLAAVATIALNEPTDRELVAKLLK